MQSRANTIIFSALLILTIAGCSEAPKRAPSSSPSETFKSQDADAVGEMREIYVSDKGCVVATSPESFADFMINGEQNNEAGMRKLQADGRVALVEPHTICSVLEKQETEHWRLYKVQIRSGAHTGETYWTLDKFLKPLSN